MLLFFPKYAGNVLPTNEHFGFGTNSNENQAQSPYTRKEGYIPPLKHTIIEAHPDVYQYMLQLGWDKIPGVEILFGRWQDVLQLNQSNIPLYDGIFFDTFGIFDHNCITNINLILF